MKQLILYFLFFVAAAVILVQCARFFPSKTKSSDTPGSSAKNEKKNAEKLTYNVSSGSAGISILPQKKPVFKIPSKEPAFTLDIVNYINHYQVWGYQYFGLYNGFINARHLFNNPHSSSFSELLLNGNDNILTASADFDLKRK